MCREIQSSEKKENVVEVKRCLSCPEASADLQTAVWSRILLILGGTQRFHYSREVWVGACFTALYYRESAENALCGQLKLTKHKRLKSSSIEPS